MPRRAIRHSVPASVVLVAALTASVCAAAALDGPGPLAAVTWPASTALLVGEVVTGGATASDEYLELYNAGPEAVDLAGLEVAYVTSSGSTITRKQSWSASLLLAPGAHLLLANASGIYAAIADGTYSGGFA